MSLKLDEFVRESNKIEGILRDPTPLEIEWTEWFVQDAPLCVGHLGQLVEIYQPGHCLRTRVGCDVRVGNHFPPRGGPEIREKLEVLLERILGNDMTPFEAHVAYESLHPMTDGNGRSGRALWAKHMLIDGQDGYWVERGFLHTFYYQSLEYNQGKV